MSASAESPHWIEVDTERLAENLRGFRRHLGAQTELAPVVKSNAYGHGLTLAARAFARGGADWLCVHSFAEAERLLGLDLRLPTLILGPLADAELAPAVAAGFHLTVYDPQRIRALDRAAAAAGRSARMHLKLETGTWRQGVDENELGVCLDTLAGLKNVELIGVSSHFANIEDTTDHSYARAQRGRFESMLQGIRQRGYADLRVHMSCSAAAILFPGQSMDLARLGIAAYGYWPSRETLVSAQQEGVEGLDLAPALRWKCRIAQVKNVPAGSFIGYGCTDKVEVDSRIAVLPVGYADGYRRGFDGRARVLVHGRRCAVRGRICMNLLMVDVSHLPEARVGDEVVLLGAQGEEELRAETLAGWADTIHYEILAGLNPRIPRVEV